MPKGRKLDGINLTPVLTGAEKEQERILGWRRRNFSERKGSFNELWAEGYIHGDWKYIKEFKEVPRHARSIKGNYPATGYVELLYNLKTDVHEDDNLAEKNPGKLVEVRAEFERWKSEVVDKDKYYKIPFPDQYSQGRQPTNASNAGAKSRARKADLRGVDPAAPSTCGRAKAARALAHHSCTTYSGSNSN